MNLPLRFWCHAALLLTAALPALAASPILVSSRSPDLAPAITGSGPSSGGVFVGPATEAGNRYVVFLSGAGDLVDVPLPVGTVNVFRRDRVDRRTELLSLTTSGAVGGRPVEGFSVTPAGDRMVFAWASGDPSAGDSNAWEDIYLRDIPAGLTRLISVRADGAGPGNGPSGAPEISTDGRFIAFESRATDLVTVEDTNRVEDVFLRNLETGVTELISATTAGTPGDRASRSPLVSSDGLRVVFQSESLDLAPLTGYGTDLLIWTRSEGALKRVTLPGVPPPSFLGSVTTAEPVLSADGRYLAFTVPARQFSQFPSGVWWINLETGVLQHSSGDFPVAGGAVPEPVSMSADGRTLAFTVLVHGAVTNQPQVRIWTPEGGLKTLEELRVTVPPASGDPAVTFQPVIAPDGVSLLFYTDEAVPDAGVPEGGEVRLYHRVLTTGGTRLIAGEEVVFAGEISADGQAVLWDTADPVLEPGDENDILDVVVSRLGDGGREVLSLVAPSSGSVAAQGISTGGNGISDDGRFLAFLSTAEDIIAGDTNRVPDGYVFDSSVPGSRRVTAPAEGSDLTARPKELVLSRSGRFVAFVTASRGWSDGDTNELADVYVSDLELGITELASAEDGTESSLNLSVDEVRLSGDGRWVSFRGNPSQGSASSGVLYLRDRVARRTTLVNSTVRTGHPMKLMSGHEMSTDGQVLLFLNGLRRWIHREGRPDLIPVDPASYTLAWLSPSGGRIVFGASINGSAGLWIRNVEGGGERLLLPSPQAVIRDVVFSADSTVLTYCRRSDPSGPSVGNPWQVWAMAVATGDEDLISRSPAGAQGSADSRVPQISADGRFIVYRTEASNLVPDGGGMTQDIVVHDRYLGVNRRLSATPAGGGGNNRSSRPEISGDGRVAAFSSAASDLVRGDGNGLEDVFLVAIPRDPAPDEDRDGLPDGWEEDRFGSHSGDGSGDADGDGSSDAAEWSAGTDPKEAASRWQVRSEFIGGAWQLRWKGTAGVQYQVERSDALSAGTWAPVGGPLAGYEGMMSFPIGEAASAGFFRVAAVRP